MQSKIMTFVKAWWPTALVTAAVLWLTLARKPLPSTPAFMLFAHADKVVHALMMGGLAATAMFDAWRRHRVLTLRNIVVAGVVVAVFSCADEWAQSITGRTSDMADALADLVGVAFAMATAIYVIQFRRS